MILLINPNSNEATTAMMVEAARPHLPTGMTIEGRTAERGPAMITGPEPLAVAAEEVVRIGLATPAQAVIVAAFADPGAEVLRQRLGVPVMGIAEAAMREAARHGRFGIATTTPGLAAVIEGRVVSLGLGAAFTGLRLTPGAPLALAADPDAQEAELADAAAACIADGARAVVIGGGPLSAAAARLRGRFDVPIIEPVPAAVRALLDLLG